VFAIRHTAIVPVSDVTATSLARTGDDIRNWFRVHSDHTSVNGDEAVALLMAKYRLPSIIRHGLARMDEISHYVMPDAALAPTAAATSTGVAQSMLTTVQMLEAWQEKLYGWYAGSEDWISGTVRTRFRPDIRIGTRLSLGGKLLAYIEGVDHFFNSPGPSYTMIRVSRGVGSMRAMSQLLDTQTREMTSMDAQSITDATNALRETETE